jgi:hypothetical protein
VRRSAAIGKTRARLGGRGRRPGRRGQGIAVPGSGRLVDVAAVHGGGRALQRNPASAGSDVGFDPGRSRSRACGFSFRGRGGNANSCRALAIQANVQNYQIGCQDAAWWTGQPAPLRPYQSSRPVPAAKGDDSFSVSGFSGVHPPKPDYQSVDPETVPACPWSPANGQILNGRLPATGRGHTLEIKNGSGGNAIVKVRHAFDGRLVISFFVASSETAAINDLPDGTYRIQYAYGNKLRQDCRSFITLLAAGQFPDAENLRTEYTGSQIIRARLSYTLFAVRSGNVRYLKESARRRSIQISRIGPSRAQKAVHGEVWKHITRIPLTFCHLIVNYY